MHKISIALHITMALMLVLLEAQDFLLFFPTRRSRLKGTRTKRPTVTEMVSLNDRHEVILTKRGSCLPGCVACGLFLSDAGKPLLTK